MIGPAGTVVTFNASGFEVYTIDLNQTIETSTASGTNGCSRSPTAPGPHLITVVVRKRGWSWLPPEKPKRPVHHRHLLGANLRPRDLPPRPRRRASLSPYSLAPASRWASRS